MLDEPSSGLTTTEIEVLISKLKLLAQGGHRPSCWCRTTWT